MNSSQKKNKVTKINARHLALKVEKPAPENSAPEKPVHEKKSTAALAYQFWLESGRHGDQLAGVLKLERCK